ncbi:hypothetical protein GOODEAATRI_008545 [Goodea atripinnis]|uniref:Secreted protein n=1 Tax=Goodea atripinnis TaxID=208336 RepID=A0ABV0PCG3_9TELE
MVKVTMLFTCSWVVLHAYGPNSLGRIFDQGFLTSQKLCHTYYCHATFYQVTSSWQSVDCCTSQSLFVRIWNKYRVRVWKMARKVLISCASCKLAAPLLTVRYKTTGNGS